MVKNDYANETERISFSLDIVKCNKDTNKNCKSDKEIEHFLNNIYLTVFTSEN